MCVDCRAHYATLCRDAPENDTGACYERPSSSYPVIFTEYCRGTQNVNDRILDLPHKVRDHLHGALEQWVPVYADIRRFEFRTPGEPGAFWISLLIDLPLGFRMDWDMKAYILGDLDLSSISCQRDDQVPVVSGSSDEDLCLVRLDWYMKRLTGFPYVGNFGHPVLGYPISD